MVFEMAGVWEKKIVGTKSKHVLLFLLPFSWDHLRLLLFAREKRSKNRGRIWFSVVFYYLSAGRSQAKQT
jgi:hypothetical protein